jgi:hypothetical protein
MKKGKSYIFITFVLMITYVIFSFSHYRTNLSDNVEKKSEGSLQPTTKNFSSEFKQKDYVDKDTHSSVNISIPKQAHIEYNKYLPSAESGSPDSQLMISLILEICSSISFKNIEDIEKVGAEGNWSEEFILEASQNFEPCSGLYKQLDGIDLNELRQAWLEEAAESGHALANLKSHFDYPGLPDKKIVLPLLYASLKLAKDNELYKGLAYKYAQRYYADFIEPQYFSNGDFEEGSASRGADRDAWDYLVCKQSTDCNIEYFEGIVTQYYTPLELAEMKSRAKEITNAIAKENWEVLSLK